MEFNHIRRFLIAFVAILGCFSAASADDYSIGAEAFRKGDYPKAIEIFQKITDNYEPSAALLYDLGTAYAAQGDFGNARLYLERAYKLDPGNKDIKSNLSYVTSKVDDANRSVMTGKRGSVEPDPRGFLGDTHQKIARDHTSDYWALFAVISFILFLGSVALYLFPSNIAARKVGFFAGLIFIIFSGIFIGFSISARNESLNHDYGIIVAYKFDLLSEPEVNSKPSSSTLTQGTKVRIVSEEADPDGNVAWYKVRINGNYLGWIPASELQII